MQPEQIHDDKPYGSEVHGGQYVCADCGQEIIIRQRRVLPPCPLFDSSHVRRSWRTAQPPREPGASGWRISLTPLNGLPSTEMIYITGQRFTIGRAADCDLQIPRAVVSRHHCVIVSEDDRVTGYDLGSRHGTYVNDERVRVAHELRDGDVLHVGVASFELSLERKE